MTLVRFGDAGRQYGENWVLRGVSFHVSAGERWGVVGRNGAGKTTLLKLLTGQEPPDEGRVWRHPGVRLSLLEQHRGEDDDGTVHEAALAAFAELLAMEARMQREATALADVDAHSATGQRLLASYDRLAEEFRRRGGYEARARAEAALEGLGFPPETWAQPVRSLSGGELGRLRLVQTLLAEPELLLLDEPTNHLDLRSTEWLEGYLKSYRGTVLFISHDRVFLENLADHVLHVEAGGATPYSGGYASFLEQREQRRALQQAQWEQQQAYIARTEEFIRRNLAGQKTNQAKSRRTLLGRLERVERPEDEERAMALRFGAARRSGSVTLKLDGVVGGYGGRVLFEPFSAEVQRGERIAVVGPNGCGKSTLMRALAGTQPPLRGAASAGMGVRVAYYRQEFTHLNPAHRIWEEVAAAAPALGMPELRSHLARFLFSGDEIDARVGDLSGGEQARVALAKVTLERANVLLLDEPTNHLDIPSREALEEALDGFDGSIVLISHDRALLSALATRVWGFVPGRAPGAPLRVEDYPGGFDDWTARRRGQEADAARTAEPSPPPAAAARAAAHAAARANGLSKNELQRRQRELQRLEAQIAAHEAEVARLEAELADPALYAASGDAQGVQARSRRREELLLLLAELYAAWERTGEELAGEIATRS